MRFIIYSNYEFFLRLTMMNIQRKVVTYMVKLVIIAIVNVCKVSLYFPFLHLSFHLNLFFMNVDLQLVLLGIFMCTQ